MRTRESPTTESTENMSALSEITDPRVDREGNKEIYFLLYLFRHTLCI